jgi:hypothetical protein
LIRFAALFAGLLTLTIGAATAETPETARYADPTLRYGHDVLGGLAPYGRLIVEHHGGTAEAILPATLVFEDIAPRLWDVTGDGRAEIVVVESHVQKGARLAVWHLAADGLSRIAVTPFIGQRHRWLAPIAVADFNGDGQADLAYVDRPHLKRDLVFVERKDGALVEFARLPGFSNHRIGDRQMTGGLRDCGDGPQIVLPDADWARLTAVTPQGAQNLGPFGEAALEAALSCR